jgi:hypothetical protein
MTSTEGLRRAIAEDDGSLPERWNPDDTPGATLIGTLLRYETIVTDFGEAQVAVIEDADDGTVWGVALFRSVLKKRFETLAPRPGDTIGLKYVGLAEPRSKGANAYHNYVLRVDHSTAVASSAETESRPEQIDDLPF